MADPAPADKPDLEAHARLTHTVLAMLLQAVHHIVDTSPAAAALRGTVDRARQMLDTAAGLLTAQEEPPPPPPPPPPAEPTVEPVAEEPMPAPDTPPLSDNVTGAQHGGDEPQPDHS